MTWLRPAYRVAIAEPVFSNRTIGIDTRIMSVCRADS